MSKIKSWEEKMNPEQKSQIGKTEKGVMYISTPYEIMEVIASVPKGKLITTEIIAKKLAKKYGTDYTCPLTTGIFTAIVANFAEEKRTKGEKTIPPYWRVLKAKGILYDKYLGNQSHQRDYLDAEGFNISPTKNKKNLVVVDYEKFLIAE